MECLKLKTCGDLIENYIDFVSRGQIKKNAKECHNTINLPLFDEEDDTYVIQKCGIPELHILQGYVNHLFLNGLAPLVGPEKALIWTKKMKSSQKITKEKFLKETLVANS